MRMNKNRIQIDINKAIKLYETGLTQTKVAQKLNTTQKVIWHRFNEIKYKCRIAKKRDQFGPKNHMWKGDNAGYASLHRRVEIKRGKPRLCSKCGTTEAIEYNWANLTGNYADVNDYIRLCRSCHAKMDGHGEWGRNAPRINGLFAKKETTCA